MRRGVIAGVLGAITACSDPTVPLPTRAVTLCSVGSTAAFQNDGGPWIQFGGTVGPYTIQATERLAIAAPAEIGPSPPFIDFYFMSATQAEEFFRCRTFPPQSYRQLSGVIQGLAPTVRAEVSFGGMAWGMFFPDTTFDSPFFPAGTIDLIAARWLEDSVHADRLIARRAQAFPTGTVPPLDFASSEAFALTQNTLSWVGPGAQVQINFRTATDNDHVLLSTTIGTPDSPDQARTAAIYSMPDAQQVAGDLHELMVMREGREVTQYYRQTGDRTVTFGPVAATPTITIVASSPYVRPRFEFASAPEYGSVVSMYLTQRTQLGPTGASVRITATREYFGGTPAKWTITIPDLTGLASFDPRHALKAGGFDWTISATNRPLFFSAAAAQPGDVMRSAGRSGTH